MSHFNRLKLLGLLSTLAVLHCGPAPSTTTGPATGSPGAPKSVAATAGNTQVTLTWLPPDSSGSSAITGYTATSNPEGKTCSTTGPCTCIITGLTNTTAYTFTVKATNAEGTGTASSASSAVTPMASVLGATWTAHNPTVHSNLTPVAWGNNQFMAVDWYDVATSPDGVTWTEHSTGLAGTGTSLYGVVWAGTQWVAIGTPGIIMTSPDGITWTLRNGYVQNVNKTVFGNKTLVCVTWTGQNIVVDSYEGQQWSSPDGITWSTGGVPMYPAQMIWDGSRLVGVGLYGTIVVANGSGGWNTPASGTTSYFASIAWTGSQYVAVGQGATIVTSPDGVTWTKRNAGGTTDDSYSSVVWTGSQLVVVGGTAGTLNSTYPEGLGLILTSPDGITWTKRSTTSTPVLSSMAWTGSKLVAVGGATKTYVLISP